MTLGTFVGSQFERNLQSPSAVIGTKRFSYYRWLSYSRLLQGQVSQARSFACEANCRPD